MDLNTGVMRFTFGDHRLAEGIDLVPLAIGLFAVHEVALHLGAKMQAFPSCQRDCAIWRRKRRSSPLVDADDPGDCAGGSDRFVLEPER